MTLEITDWTEGDSYYIKIVRSWKKQFFGPPPQSWTEKVYENGIKNGSQEEKENFYKECVINVWREYQPETSGY
jgi:hypothetical protein